MSQPSPTSAELPDTSYAILGILTFGEASGYDLWKLANRSIRFFFWNPAKSQVYAELRRLASLGYATEREVRQERRPDKRLYRITAEGEQALRGWLESSRPERDPADDSFLLKVFFGAHMEPDVLRSQIEACRVGAAEALEQFQAMEAELAHKPGYFHPYLTLLAGIAHTRATVEWADRAAELLDRKGKE